MTAPPRHVSAPENPGSDGGPPVIPATRERPGHGDFVIREARTEEFEELGQLMVKVYSNLEGFPGKDEQPKYYDLMTNIGQLTRKPNTKLLVVVAGDKVIGGLAYFSDMIQYGSGGTATREQAASGFRLLAVDPDARGTGVGKALAKKCIELAREAGNRQVIIHTTNAMKIAWGMYERLGFKRSPDLDFMQERLQVFGFRLEL
jgi:GNAT superfamily N-acetyltransferase